MAISGVVGTSKMAIFGVGGCPEMAVFGVGVELERGHQVAAGC